MMNKGLYILGILVTLGFATFAQWKYMCMNCEKSSHENQPTVSEIIENPVPLNGFSFSKDGVGFICNDNFKFEGNGFVAKMPVSDSIDLGIFELLSFLERHPNEKARIVGICLANEENTSAFPNLGMARANQIKNYIVSKGIPSDRLDMTGKVVESWDMQNNVVKGPINIEIISANRNMNWSAFKQQIQKNPLALKFNSGDSKIELTMEQRETIANLARYLDQIKDSKISIVGHTDNLGDRQANIRLGLERANFAKSYLAKNGIDVERIEASSMGPDVPIADNSLESGRSKNRRTVVTLK